MAHLLRYAHARRFRPAFSWRGTNKPVRIGNILTAKATRFGVAKQRKVLTAVKPWHGIEIRLAKLRGMGTAHTLHRGGIVVQGNGFVEHTELRRFRCASRLTLGTNNTLDTLHHPSVQGVIEAAYID